MNLGVVSLNPDIIEKLNKPESHVVLTWGGKDPTLSKMHKQDQQSSI